VRRRFGCDSLATTVLHGDHGSRIKHSRSVGDEDIVDHYSAMFAIKSSQIDTGYTDHLEPLQNLLARAAKVTPPVTEDQVYLLDKRYGAMQKRVIDKAMWMRM